MAVNGRINYHINPLIYQKGKVVKSDYNGSMFEICTSGIHFFLTEKDALDFAAEQCFY